MKKYSGIVLTIVLIISVQYSEAQVWPKYYGEPNRKDYSYDIIETYDKGLLMCGGYFTDESTWSWLIKTDINGNVLWEKILECNGMNYLLALHPLMDGGVIACGAINYGEANQMPYVVKLNECGEKIWCKSFYSSEPLVLPWAQDVKETPSGDIVILVNTFGDYPEETMHLLKLNSEGDMLWKKAYCSGYIHPESALPLGNKVIITLQNEYLITGDVYWEDPWSPGSGKWIRPLFILVDSLGIEKWVLPFGLNDTLRGTGKMSIEPLFNDKFVATGSNWIGNDQIKPLLMRFDENGNELDYHIEEPENFSTNIIEGAFVKIVQNEAKYYLEGIVEIEPGEVYPLFDASIDTNIFSQELQIYDSAFYLLLSEPHNLIKTSDNKLINNSTFKETGNWEIALSKLNLSLEYDTLDPGNYNYDSLCTTPGLPQSGFIYLDDCDIITEVDIPSPEEYYAHLKTIPITAYPNPATKGSITFEFENTEHHTHIQLKCFNIYGKEVYHEKVYRHQGESLVSIYNWTKGFYMAVIYSDGLPVGECKFVVQ
ncbi:MAG: T9SS type A sorting domain-containing protein [Bacteroidales bacterium]|nr:T9SS type A sorting domain-containing protein [Bacteroidales bacterium]MCF8403540.1 T9SS type A sorting domain-containing protein [Bacteroidales bacterium]